MLNYPIFYDPRELSPREKEIKNLVCIGKDIKQIAEELYIAPCTVRTHLHNIYEKTNLRSQKALMVQRIKELEDKINELTSGADKT